MRIEELLKPRYLVIADYPGSIYRVGQIADSIHPQGSFGKYPHLFRKLEWWEKRKASERPNFVKLDLPGGTGQKVIKVEGWDKEGDRITYKSGGGTLAHYLTPATEQEYQDYLKKQE